MKMNEGTWRVVVPFTTAPSRLLWLNSQLPPAYAIGSSQGGTSQWTKAVNLDIPHHRPAAF